MEKPEGKKKSKFSVKPRQENENLKEEKMKALKVLKNSSIGNNLSYTPSPLQQKYPNSPGLNFTDYGSYRWKDTFNISVTDNTINFESLQNNNNNNNKISNPITFEPSEITGRSTSYIPKDLDIVKTLSVEQILASSCSEKLRNLRHSLCSSSSGNGSRKTSESLPRTADVSITSIRDSLLSSSIQKPSFTEFQGADESGFAGSSFVPIENFLSKLSADEKEWEKEYADIPIKNKNKSKNKIENSKFGDFSGSCLLQPEMSMGTYFQARTPDLQNIVSLNNSPKKRKPVALLNDSDLVPERDDISKLEKDNNLFEIPSKDSIYGTTLNKLSEGFLSLSTIENALKEIDVNASGTAVINHLLKNKKINEKLNYVKDDGICSVHSNQMNKPIQNLPETIENKENFDPKNKQIEFSDTVSFTESLLEISKTKEDKENDNEAKSEYFSILPNNTEVFDKAKIQSSSNRDKKRKRSYSERHESFQQKCSIYSPIQLAKPSKRNNTKSQEIDLNVNQIVNSADNTQSTLSSKSPNKSPTNCCPHSNCSRRSKSPTSSLENTVIDDKKLSCNTACCCSPGYGKFSLPLNAKLRSKSNLSTKSGSSEYQHQGGKLPLKVTRIDLSWGSVKLRKTVQKSVQFKNTSNKRLVIRTEITGPGFQIVNSEQSNLLTFHSQECRTVVVSFCPTVIGVAVGKLRFCLAAENSSEKQVIKLHGYGGHSSIIPQGILRGPIGSPFLTMGELKQLSHPLHKTFTLYNKGSLTGFAIISTNSMGLDIPRLCDLIEINPKKIIIYPQSEIEITIKFKPRRDDVKKIFKKISNVITLAQIRIICGDEPTRQRIRKLIKNMNDKEKSNVSSNELDCIWNDFPNETPYNLDDLKEETETAMELIETLRTHEISLTLNHTQLDESIETTICYPENDETVMFRTILTNCCDDTLQSLKSNQSECFEIWSIKPQILQIDPIKKKKTKFIVSNKFSKIYDFQIDANYKDLFEFYPKEGKFYPGKDVDVTVLLLRPCPVPQDIFITVYIENAKISIPVNIITDNYAICLQQLKFFKS